MNILLVSDVYLPTVSGVASSTDSIARFMAKRGHTVYLVCPKPLVPYSPKPQLGLNIIFTPPFRDPMFVNKSMTLFPLALGAIWHVLRNYKIDVAHIQEPGPVGTVALILAKFFRVPTVGADHFSLLQVQKIAPPFIRWASVPFIKLYIKFIYRHHNAIMVPTKTAASELSSFIGRKKSIYPVSNGVDTALYTPHRGTKAKLYKKYKLDPKNVHFLYLGRLDPDKNTDTILHALTRTPETVHFLLAGTGKETERLRILSEELDLTRKISWFQDLDLDAILDLYHVADVFVIMSPVETQSIVALQAIACGLPLIAASAGALPELVEDGQNGYVLPTYDEDALAEKMKYLATHEKLRTQMGENSRRLSQAHHKPVVLAELEKIYKSIVGK